MKAVFEDWGFSFEYNRGKLNFGFKFWFLGFGGTICKCFGYEVVWIDTEYGVFLYVSEYRFY